MSDNDLWGLPEDPLDNTQQPMSTASAVQEWVNSLPQVYNTQLEYAPKEAEQQYALLKQYALPYAQTLKNAQASLYPNETRLNNLLTERAIDGMNGGVPEWMRTQYKSDLNSQLGANSGSGIGADYVSRGLQGQAQDWQKYYQNLGLSITGRQPVITANNTPNTSNFVSGYTPNTVMSYLGNNYGNYSNALSNSYRTQAGIQGNYLNTLSSMYGSSLGSAGTMMAFSSARFKENIKTWA